MALHMLEGFEWLGAPGRTDVAIREIWRMAHGFVHYDVTTPQGTVAGRSGRGSAIALNTANIAAKYALQYRYDITNGAEMTLGMGVFIPSGFPFNTARTGLLRLLPDMGDNGALLDVSSTGVLSLYRYTSVNASYLLHATATGTFPFGAWNYLELNYKWHASAGKYELRLNGSPIASGANLNTLFSTSTSAHPIGMRRLELNAVLQGHLGNGCYTAFDDIYLKDDSDPDLGFWGPITVEPLWPNGTGSSSMFVSSTGASNWQNVDESPMSLEDYNTGSTVGDKDLYTMGNLPNFTAVHGIVARPVIGLNAPVERRASGIIKVGGTTFEAPAQRCSTFRVTSPLNFAFTNNPATGQPWTIPEINAFEAGVKIVV